LKHTFKDIHSHIIPCIDDGSGSLESSLKMLKTMENAGTKELFLTPHYSMRRRYKTSSERILSKFEEFENLCKNIGIGIRLHCGCEIEYSADVPSLLQAGELVTLDGTKYILLEFAPYIEIREIIEAVRTIVQLGFIPIIAHIERYPALKNRIVDIEILKSMGAMVQTNIDYIISRPIFVDDFLKTLISENIIDFIAGDVHMNPYSYAQLNKCAKIIEKYSSEDYVNDVFYKNFDKILIPNEGEK